MVPALSNGFVGQGVLPTPEGATAATSITGMQGEHTREVGGGVATVCASHQQLPALPSGAGPGLEDAR